MDEDPALPDAERLFEGEARRRVALIREIVRRGFPPQAPRDAAELWRHAHSLTGTAGSLGHERIAEISADLATLLAPERRAALSPEAQETVLHDVDELARAVDDLGQP